MKSPQKPSFIRDGIEMFKTQFGMDIDRLAEMPDEFQSRFLKAADHYMRYITSKSREDVRNLVCEMYGIPKE